MTRIAIVAPTEELRAALAAALRTDARFDVVSVGTDEREVSAAADVVVVARPSAETSLSARTAHDDIADSAVLSNRERQVLALLADGLGNKQIAARLGISTNTVKTHLELLFEKGRPSNRAVLQTVFARTPRGRQQSAAAREVNKALRSLRGQKLDQIRLTAGPSRHTLTIETEACRLTLELDAAGARVGSLEIG